MIRQRAAHRFSSSTLRRAAAAGLALLLAGAVMPASAATKPAAKADKAASAKASTGAGKKASAQSGKALACYNRAEHAAEQTIRMHTEMMVVGLTCQQVTPDKKPFNLYQDFTIKNRTLISNSEAALIDYYRKHGTGNPTRQMDMFRTELANEISRRAAIIGTPLYCETFVDRSKAATELTPDDLRILASDEKNAGLMHLSSKPLCDVQVVSNPDAPYAVAQATTPTSRTGKGKATGKAPAKSPAKPKVAAKTAMLIEKN